LFNIHKIRWDAVLACGISSDRFTWPCRFFIHQNWERISVSLGLPAKTK
jgi:hypothetical protein